MWPQAGPEHTDQAALAQRLRLGRASLGAGLLGASAPEGPVQLAAFAAICNHCASCWAPLSLSALTPQLCHPDSQGPAHRPLHQGPSLISAQGTLELEKLLAMAAG